MIPEMTAPSTWSVSAGTPVTEPVASVPTEEGAGTDSAQALWRGGGRDKNNYD